jgi:hypothetical protein
MPMCISRPLVWRGNSAGAKALLGLTAKWLKKTVRKVAALDNQCNDSPAIRQTPVSVTDSLP